MDFYDGYGPAPILFSLRSKQNPIELNPETIVKYLPGLYHMIAGTLWQYGAVYRIPEDFGSFRDSASQKALRYLFEYLEDIERCGVSAALDNSLERVWKACNSRPRHRHPTRHPDDVTEVFSQLGMILDDDHFGCNDIIFATMSSFFIRHCREIMRRGRGSWIKYIFALDRIAENEEELVPALNCIAQQKIHPAEIESVYSVKIQGHELYLETFRLLNDLVDGKEYQDRDHYLMGFGHLDDDYIGRGRRRGYRKRGGRRHHGPIRCGIDFHPGELKYIVKNSPEAILVDERLKRRSHHRLRYYDDDYSDSEYESGYDLEYDRMRRTRHDHMIKDGGRRLRSMSMDSLHGRPMDGFMEDLEMYPVGRGRRLAMARH